jgi:NAD(P)-dependent dehydrogenase (short-subunit alcohol dehydrogenase family)
MKTAFVTGSSRGIGRAIALRLARSGVQVWFHGTKESPELDSAVAEAGENARKCVGDLTSVEGVKQLIAQLPEKIDILVLNASVQIYTYIEQFDPAEFDREMAVNVRSAFQLLEAVLPGMKERQYGRIIAVSSINQTKPAARLAVYSATKSALANLMRTAAREYAQYGITVNTIQPGVIITDRNREVLKNEEFANKLKADIPAHRFGEAEECAALTVFLAGDEAGYITGAEVPISGGWQL